LSKGVAYAIISAICFGMLAILGKLAFAEGLSPLQMMQYRFGFASIMLFIYFYITDRRCLHASKATVFKAAFFGICMYPIQSICYMYSLKFIPASTTSLVFYFYPVAVTLLSALIFKTRITLLVSISLLFTLFGCGLVFFDAFSRNVSQIGILFALAAMAIFSVYLILLQSMLRGENSKTVTFYVVLTAAIVYTILEPPTAFFQLKPMGMILGVALGLIPTALAITLLYEAVDRIGSAFTSICSTIEPIATVLASAFLLNESIVFVQILGMGCILLGILLPNSVLLLQARRLHRKTITA